MNVVAPNVANLTRGGAIVMMAIAATTPGYLDIGNIPDFSYSTPTQFVEHKTSRSGKILMDRREPTEFAMSFKMSSDEMNAANMALIFNSNAASAFSQAAGTITLTLATPILGATYPTGDFRIGNVVVTVSSVIKTLGTDYALEADGGAIRILPTGSILHSDTVIVTYTRPAITGDQISPLSNASSISGALQIYFRASDGRLWVFQHTTAQLAFTGDTALAGGEFAKTQAEITVMPDYNSANRFGTWTLLPGA